MGAASIYGDEALEEASTVKLGRTLRLIPITFIVALYAQRAETRVRIPAFILLFVLASVFGSMIGVGGDVLDAVKQLSKSLIVVALFCIGLGIEAQTLRSMKIAAVGQAALIWFLVLGSTLWLVS